MSSWRARDVFLAVCLTALLGYAVFYLSTPIAQMDREGRQHANIYLIALGAIGFIGGILSWTRPARGAKDRVLVALAFLIPSYAAFQILPLPLSVLRLASPARARLLDALAPLALRPDWAPLSVAPALTFEHVLLFGGYAVVFFIVRGVSRGGGAPSWLMVLPVIAVGGWQAVWGMTQFFAGGGQVVAQAMFPNRNHFAGFLEMALPLTIGYGAAAIANRRRGEPLTGSAALRAGIAFTIAALMLAAIVCSLSRMGVVSALGSLTLMSALALTGRVRPATVWAAVLGITVTLVIVLALVAPVEAIMHFAEISGEDRPNVWRDTLHLIAAYPVFGCGLGGYESTFTSFKTSAFELLQDYAHNDYLQYLAELGALGFLLVASFIGVTGFHAARAALSRRDVDTRWLGLACAGAIAAILIHSAADFNLYVISNATLLAWVCGLAPAPPHSRAVPLRGGRIGSCWSPFQGDTGV